MSQVKKAVILAAGRGTRMKEITDELPKPMVKVKGMPILESIVRGLVSNGITDFLIVVGWRKEVITDYFGDGSDFGCRVEYVEQVVQDGTGRVVELARDFSGDDPFILSYGDILVPAESYAPLVNFTNVEGKLTVKIDEDVRKGGAVFIVDGMVTDLIEKGGDDAPTSPTTTLVSIHFPRKSTITQQSSSFLRAANMSSLMPSKRRCRMAFLSLP